MKVTKQNLVKLQDFTFKQLKIEGTFGIGIARNEIPDFDETVKKLPNVLFGSLAKKLVKETFKKSSPFYNSLGSEVAVADGVIILRNKSDDSYTLKTEKGCAIFYKPGSEVAKFIAYQSVKQYDKNSFIEELEKKGKVSLGRYEFRMVQSDGVWYGACVSPKDSDDEVISTARQLDRYGSFDSVVNKNLKDRQMALLQRANEHLTADLSY